MSARRKRLLTRGHVVAWLISLALGLGWVGLLGLLPSDFDPIVGLLLGLVGMFGFVGGILIATGMLVRMLAIFGTRPGSMSSPAGELPPDAVFGICVICFVLPSLFLYYGG
jgi:hypothetical protein